MAINPVVLCHTSFVPFLLASSSLSFSICAGVGNETPRRQFLTVRFVTWQKSAISCSLIRKLILIFLVFVISMDTSYQPSPRTVKLFFLGWKKIFHFFLDFPFPVC